MDYVLFTILAAGSLTPAYIQLDIAQSNRIEKGLSKYPIGLHSLSTYMTRGD